MANYTEMYGYPQEQFGENGQMYVQRKLKCAWADRYAVLIEVAGNGGQVYPYYHSGSGLSTNLCVANGAGILPFGRMDKDLVGTNFASEAVYEYAIVTVQYSTTTAVKLGSVWVTEELQPTSRLINVNVTNPQQTWADASLVDPSDNIVRLETSFDYVVTYHHLTGIPPAAYAYPGYVNSAPVGSLLLGLTFNPETLLFTRPVVVRSFDPGIMSTFRLTYRFSFNPNEWNKHFHINAYQAMSGDPIYPSVNFSSLVP